MNEIEKDQILPNDESIYSIKTFHQEDNNSQTLERVTVHPRILNQSEFASFQLNCFYVGFNFANIKLLWLKNDRLLQIEDGTIQVQPPIGNLHHPRRFFMLNYKQNYTSIGVLKFSYGLINDSGEYKCVALDENDSMKISLNDSSYLFVHKSKKILFL